MTYLTRPLALIALFIVCLICAVIIWLCMGIDWIFKQYGEDEPFCIIKGIKDLEATDTDAYIN